jgi:ammonia channel protein AmtB
MPAAVPGHNQVLVLFGCLLALVGWMGLNAAGSLLFAGIAPGRVVLVAVNTLLSAGGAVLAAAVITRYRFGKPDASLSANGWVSGLVASSAGCAFVPPAAALLIGLVAGALVTYTVAWMEARLGLDDPAGAVSVHAIGGIWGILAVGLFPRAAAVAIAWRAYSAAAPTRADACPNRGRCHPAGFRPAVYVWTQLAATITFTRSAFPPRRSVTVPTSMNWAPALIRNS